MATTKTQTITTAKISYIGQPKENQFGKVQVSIKFMGQTGDYWLNLNPTDPVIANLAVGQVHSIAVDGNKVKTLFHAEDIQDQSQEVVTVESVKRQIASDIQTQAKLYRYCYTTALETMGDLIQDQALIKDIATTLFIQAGKR